jgi:hypothetical protein
MLVGLRQSLAIAVMRIWRRIGQCPPSFRPFDELRAGRPAAAPGSILTA